MKSVPKAEAGESPFGETEAAGLPVALKTDGLSIVGFSDDILLKGKVASIFTEGIESGL